MNLRVVVADDHAITRAGTISILQREPDIQVVGEAPDGFTALTMCEELQPQLLVLDVRMPGMSGIEVAQKLRLEQNPPRILLLSGYADPALVRAASNAGVAAYALKSLPGHELIARVRQVMEDRPKQAKEPPSTQQPQLPMTPDEMIILCLLAKGLPVRQIATHLDRDLSIVVDQLAGICEKLGARSYSEAVLIAQQERLLANT